MIYGLAQVGLRDVGRCGDRFVRLIEMKLSTSCMIWRGDQTAPQVEQPLETYRKGR